MYIVCIHYTRYYTYSAVCSSLFSIPNAIEKKNQQKKVEKNVLCVYMHTYSKRFYTYVCAV